MGIRIDVSENRFGQSGFTPFQTALELSNKDDGYQYRHVANNPKKIAYRKSQGYEMVTRENDKVLMVDGSEVPGGRLQAGDGLVLMRRPVEIYEKHLEVVKRRTAQALAGPTERFKAIAEQHGVEVEDTSRASRGPLSRFFNKDDDE